jgi:hypothetical protein
MVKCCICGRKIDIKDPHGRQDTMAHEYYQKWICGCCRDVIINE